MSFIEGWGNSLTEAFRAFGIEQRQKKQRASPSGRSHPAASEPPFSEAQNEFVQGLLQSSLFGVGTYLSDRFAETDLKVAEVLKVAQDVALQVQQTNAVFQAAVDGKFVVVETRFQAIEAENKALRELVGRFVGAPQAGPAGAQSSHAPRTEVRSTNAVALASDRDPDYNPRLARMGNIARDLGPVQARGKCLKLLEEAGVDKSWIIEVSGFKNEDGANDAQVLFDDADHLLVAHLCVRNIKRRTDDGWIWLSVAKTRAVPEDDEDEWLRELLT